MIRIVSFGGKFCPHVFCDACGERIKQVREAHILWFTEANGAPADQGKLYHTHNGRCNAALEAMARAQGLDAAWTPLDAHVVQFAANVGIKTPAEWKAAREDADLMAGKGTP